MKLAIAIVQDDDALDLVEELTEKGFRVTKLATTGGFLKSGNTTLLVGVEKEKVDEVLAIIGDTCKQRKQIQATPAPISETTGVFIPYPMEIEAGGATVFVVDVDKFVRI